MAKAVPKRKRAAPKRKKAAKRSARKAPPPYKCETTGERGVCLRFNRNPRTGKYNLPPGGIRMRCSECEHFFD